MQGIRAARKLLRGGAARSPNMASAASTTAERDPQKLAEWEQQEAVNHCKTA